MKRETANREGHPSNVVRLVTASSSDASNRHLHATGLYDGNGSLHDNALESDHRRQAVQRVMRSKSFARASRLSAFLLYICERTIDGHTEEITEQQIGVRVFGRPANYNPGDDNIVRGTARLLRQRLDLYYQDEGHADELRITVPRGTYVPRFQRLDEAQNHPEADSASLPEEMGHEARPARSGFANWWIAGALVLAFCLGAAVLLAFQHFTRARSRPASPAAALWHAVFPGNKRTLIIAGDAGVDMFDNLAKRQVNVNEYSERTYLSSPFAQTPENYHWAPLATRAYVSVQDMKLAAALVRLPEVRNNPHVFLHYAREIRPEDLMDANAVLIGSPAFNPWVQLFDKDLDFSMVYDGDENSITVINRHPAPGEKSSYKWIWNDPEHAYALIALTNNLNGTGKVLLVEATTTMPTAAASDLLLDPGPMEQILARATKPDGSLKRFEVLLETSLVGNSSTEPKVIAVHIHNQ